MIDSRIFPEPKQTLFVYDIGEEYRHSWRESDEVSERIRSFATLPSGWDVGQGVPAPRDVVSRALNVYFIGRAMGLTGDAVPNADGGISVLFWQGGISAEVHVERGGRYQIDFEGENIEDDHQLEIETNEETYRQIASFSRRCRSFESSIQNTFTEIRADLEAPASSHSEGESLSSNWGVLGTEQSEDRYALI